MTQEKQKDIGGLWKRVSKNGNSYLSGVVNGQMIVVFPNTKKQEGERTPDYRIYAQTPMGKPDDAPLRSETFTGPMSEADMPF